MLPSLAKPFIRFGRDRAPVPDLTRVFEAAGLRSVRRAFLGQTWTEAMIQGLEGTDQCLARGGELAGKDGGAVAVKVAREKHDMRFDIPCLGAKTVDICASSGVSVLALEAGKTLLLEEDEVKQLASKHSIALTTVS